MIDFRKLLVTLVIAILFAILVNTTIQAIHPQPDYNDFCGEKVVGPYPTNYETTQTAEQKKAMDEYNAKSRECQERLSTAQKEFDYVVFITSSIAGIVAIVAGLYVSVQTPVGMSIASGLLLGGLFTLFFGTMSSWGNIGAVVKPIIILVEIIVVIVVAYKRLNEPQLKSSKSK